MGQGQSAEKSYDSLVNASDSRDDDAFELIETPTSPTNGKVPVLPTALPDTSPDESSSASEDDDEIVVYHSHEDDSAVRLLPGAVILDQAAAKKKRKKPRAAGEDEPRESLLSITLQVLFPFYLAGFGMVGAGLVLDEVQHWEVFEKVDELFILVPALLGLKGNLEMTLASRLSTHANIGNMDTRADTSSMVISNLALVQCQAIVVALLASLFAVTMGWAQDGVFEFDHALLLCASSLVTASLASFALGTVMVIVILASRRCKINPDNVATPIAASLGDLITQTLLAWMAYLLYEDLDKDKWLAPVLIGGYLLFLPVCVLVAYQNEHTRKVLRSGWTPVILAMVISSSGGMILGKAVDVFKGIAVFQPVMNGVGGNLVAVQASRITTSLHRYGPPGTLPPSEESRGVCTSPWGIFCDPSHGPTASILLFLTIPGHLVFTYTIAFLEAGHTSPTLAFLSFFLLAALLQVWILLHTAHWMIRLMWRRETDPDNSAIPYLTALGDLLGGAFLFAAFTALAMVGDQTEL